MQHQFFFIFRGRNRDDGFFFVPHNVFPFLKRLILEKRIFVFVVGENVNVLPVGIIETINPVVNLNCNMAAKQTAQLSVSIAPKRFGHRAMKNSHMNHGSKLPKILSNVLQILYIRFSCILQTCTVSFLPLSLSNFNWNNR